jgi:F-type H+-transporting ATPase subunit c
MFLFVLIFLFNFMELIYIGIGLMAIAMLGATIAIGIIFSSLLNGIARNPEAESRMSKYAYVGAGFAESIGLFALIVALLLIFK